MAEYKRIDERQLSGTNIKWTTAANKRFRWTALYYTHNETVGCYVNADLENERDISDDMEIAFEEHDSSGGERRVRRQRHVREFCYYFLE